MSRNLINEFFIDIASKTLRNSPLYLPSFVQSASYVCGQHDFRLMQLLMRYSFATPADKVEFIAAAERRRALWWRLPRLAPIPPIRVVVDPVRGTIKVIYE